MTIARHVDQASPTRSPSTPAPKAAAALLRRLGNVYRGEGLSCPLWGFSLSTDVSNTWTVLEDFIKRNRTLSDVADPRATVSVLLPGRGGDSGGGSGGGGSGRGSGGGGGAGPGSSGSSGPSDSEEDADLKTLKGLALHFVLQHGHSNTAYGFDRSTWRQLHEHEAEFLDFPDGWDYRQACALLCGVLLTEGFEL